jgi:hypothetical protein
MGDAIKSLKTIRRPVLANRAKTASATETILSVHDAYTLDANGNALHAGPNDVVFGIVLALELEAVPTIMNGNGPVSVDQMLTAYAGAIIGIEDTNAYFEVQTDNFNTNNENGLFNLVDALANTLFRQSQQSITTGAAGVQFRAIDIVNRPTDNAYGANARAIVRLSQAVA